MANRYLDKGNVHRAAMSLRIAVCATAQILPALEGGARPWSYGDFRSWKQLQAMVPHDHQIQHVIKRLMQNPLCYRIGHLGLLFLPPVGSQVRSGIADGLLLTSEILKFANLEQGKSRRMTEILQRMMESYGSLASTSQSTSSTTKSWGEQ